MNKNTYKVVGIDSGRVYFKGGSFDEAITYKNGYETAKNRLGELWHDEYITYRIYNYIELVTITIEGVSE